MNNIIKLILATASVALLSACGGGGSGGTPATVASTSEFNLLSAYQSSFRNTSTSTFAITGSQDAVAITGSGRGTNGVLSSGTFEGGSAQQRTSTVTGTFFIDGQSFPLNYSSVAWVDSNYLPLGSDGDEYTVVVGIPTIPTAAKVGDSGPLYISNRFTNPSKNIPLGTIISTYVVEEDTASTALVTFISTYKNTSNTTELIVSAQYRVNTTNAFTRIKETAFDLTNGLSLTFTF
jgi:hypothetical protein